MRKINAALFFLLLLVPFAHANVEVTLFGPAQFTRTNGKPNVFLSSFPAVAGKGTLVVTDGDLKAQNRISSAVISINGSQILGPSDFSQKVSEKQVSVALRDSNSLSVELRSAPGSFLTIQIIQQVNADAAAVIGSSGGIIATPDDKSTIVIPQGSIPSACIILIKELINPSFHKVYSFSPSGLTFTEPVQIILKYDTTTLSPGISETDLYIGILNDNFEQIEILGDSTVDVVNKFITATTLHFSNIAVASPTNLTQVSSPAASDFLRFKTPVNNAISTRPYNYKLTDVDYHTGIDLNGDSTIRSTAFGKVFVVQSNDPINCTDHGLGNAVIIEHYRPGGTKIYSLYGHMNSISVTKDQWVNQKEAIGIMGGTGNTWQWPLGIKTCTPKNWPVHLHFEIKDLPKLENPSGTGIYWGYTPPNPDNFGYHNPVDYFDKKDVQVAFLAKADGSADVFWVQNGKRYHVLPGIIEKMSGLPTWSWDKVATYPSGVISNFEFHQKDFIVPNSNSDGLLIREINTSEVYLIENGIKRHIKSIDEFNQMGFDWNDVIIVTHDLISMFDAPPPGTWLSFVEGNPGIPGDGIIIDSNNGNIPGPFFELAIPIRLSDLAGGFSCQVFPAAGSPLISEVQLGITNFQSNGPCQVWMSALASSAGPPPTTNILQNGVLGVSTRVSPAWLQAMLQWINQWNNQYRPMCPNVSLNDLYLIYILINVWGPPYQWNTLDAAAIIK